MLHPHPSVPVYKGHSFLFQKSYSLKGPKLEIFVVEFFFTQSKSVWVDDLGTRKYILFLLCLGQYISLLIGEIFICDVGDRALNFLAMSVTALKSTKGNFQA